MIGMKTGGGEGGKGRSEGGGRCIILNKIAFLCQKAIWVEVERRLFAKAENLGTEQVFNCLCSDFLCHVLFQVFVFWNVQIPAV